MYRIKTTVLILFLLFCSVNGLSAYEDKVKPGEKVEFELDGGKHSVFLSEENEYTLSLDGVTQEFFGGPKKYLTNNGVTIEATDAKFKDSASGSDVPKYITFRAYSENKTKKIDDYERIKIHRGDQTLKLKGYSGRDSYVRISLNGVGKKVTEFSEGDIYRVNEDGIKITEISTDPLLERKSTPVKFQVLEERAVSPIYEEIEGECSYIEEEEPKISFRLKMPDDSGHITPRIYASQGNSERITIGQSPNPTLEPGENQDKMQILPRRAEVGQKKVTLNIESENGDKKQIDCGAHKINSREDLFRNVSIKVGNKDHNLFRDFKIEGETLYGIENTKWDFDGDGKYEETSPGGGAQRNYDSFGEKSVRSLIIDKKGNQELAKTEIELENQTENSAISGEEDEENTTKTQSNGDQSVVESILSIFSGFI